MLTMSNTQILIFLTVTIFLYVSGKNIPRKQGDNQQQQGSEKEERYVLSKDVNCAEDVKKLCSKTKKENNFAVFVCLQEAAQRDEDDVSDDCHQTLWHYKYNLTQNTQFDDAASNICKSTVKELEKECKGTEGTPGFLMNCLVEHRHLVKEESCEVFLKKMSSIIFADYRLIKGFYDDCATDVKKTNCGMISAPTDEVDSQHEQSEVVSCLESDLDKISDKCQARLERIAELQADDYHLDRPLFYSCQEARERFCPDIKSGEGRVYKCLLSHVSEDLMPEECGKKLQAREKMMQKNVKVNYPLWKECKTDYEKYKCSEQTIKGTTTKHGQASSLLLCLQGQIAAGKTVVPNCQAEMRSFAIMVFENYQVSPIVVASCDKEIHKTCQHLIGKRDDGDMMDCLMTQAATDESISKQCFEAISEVLKETGAGSNYKVDRALYLACEPVISSLCKGKEDMMVLGCLMENAHSSQMPETCATQVFHLQYFLARDFRLDTSLYQDCKQDAEEICHAEDWDAKSETKLPDNFVVACLYRNAIMQEGEKQVSKKCAAHVERIMRERAESVKLLPEIESFCLEDLGKHCTDKSGKNEEVDCLQQNYEKLSAKCQAGIKQFTELESKDFDLDKHLVDKCANMVTKFCQSELEDGDGERVLPCLVEHKNDIDMEHTCASAVEHWQLLEMKDFNFSPALKEMCLKDILKLCKSSKSKFEAVTCLSEKIVTDHKQVSEHCRAQVKNELMEQGENMKLNPTMFEACHDDISTFCPHVASSGAQLEECLRKNRHKLQNSKCKNLLYQLEKAESNDPELDYRLTHACKTMIKKYCAGIQHASDILSCLRQNVQDAEMGKTCRDVVFERQVEQAESFELDQELSSYCHIDVMKHCRKEYDTANHESDNGEIFGCLVQALMNKKKLKPECEQFVRRREAEASYEVDLNPMFLQQCRTEMDRLCPELSSNEVIDCMKKNVKNIKPKACVQEVKKLIAEGIEDIHVDPHLQEQCARDIRTFCSEMPRKSGNVVLCLMDIHKAKSIHLQATCDNFLSKRMELYSDAGVDLASFDSISAVMDAVSASPNRNYIYTTIMVILAILFLGGIILGRFTKKIRAEVKNR